MTAKEFVEKFVPKFSQEKALGELKRMLNGMRRDIRRRVERELLPFWDDRGKR